MPLRSSTTVPVSSHTCVAAFSLKMWNARGVSVSHMTAHQKPSFHHSFDCGFETVGGTPLAAE